jgi:hypothetical protein
LYRTKELDGKKKRWKNSGIQQRVREEKRYASYAKKYRIRDDWWEGVAFFFTGWSNVHLNFSTRCARVVSGAYPVQSRQQEISTTPTEKQKQKQKRATHRRPSCRRPARLKHPKERLVRWRALLVRR